MIIISRNKYPEETVSSILDAAEKLFIEKGYDNTSIQDIINNLGGLSKGAIYHHFKSKEDLFYAVCNRYNEQLVCDMNSIMYDSNLSGLGKLRKMFDISLTRADKDIMYTVAPNMLKNPRLLAMQIDEIFTTTAPLCIRPVIEDGIKDGSIRTDYPKELSEVILLLCNVWLSPFVLMSSAEERIARVKFFNLILSNMGITLLDDKLLDEYKHYCTTARLKINRVI